MGSFKICDRLVGNDFEPLVIAEIGINHAGSIDLAITLADSALDVGAEIVKHQTHVVEDEMSEEAKNIIPGNAEQSIYEIMKKCALSERDEFRLMQHVISRGGIFISTPFSRQAAKRLMSFNVPAFKIGSGECNNYPLVQLIASFGKPVIMSTGMNSIETIRPSVRILRENNVPFALLHCTNLYPTPPHLVRLGALGILQKEFPDAVIGLSDHTVDNYTCLGAVALGACILERHYTDSYERDGPDIACSMDQKGLKDLINGSKTIHKAMGGDKTALAEENITIAFAFSSVVASKNIEIGETLTTDNIWLKRPFGGDFTANDYDKLLGKKVRNFILEGQRLTKPDII